MREEAPRPLHQKHKKICRNCGEGFYVQTYRKNKAKYCSKRCANTDPNKLEKRIKHARATLVKWTKKNGQWRTGKTKHEYPQLSIPRNGENFGPAWTKGKTKENEPRLKAISDKNKVIIQKMYDEGKIDLSKRKTDYKALGQRVSDTMSRKLANGTLKNQYRFVKGWFKKKDGTEEWYESSYEKKYMKILDERGDVWVKRHGIRIQYLDPTTNVKRYYVPDFLVNGNEIHEVKPLKHTTLPKVMAKTASAQQYCLTNNLKYTIITEANLNL